MFDPRTTMTLMAFLKCHFWGKGIFSQHYLCSKNVTLKEYQSLKT